MEKVLIIIILVIKMIFFAITHPKKVWEEAKESPWEMAGIVLFLVSFSLMIYFGFKGAPEYLDRDEYLKIIDRNVAIALCFSVLCLISVPMYELGYRSHIKKRWMIHTDRDFEDYDGRGYTYRIDPQGVTHKILTERGRLPSQEGLNIDEWKANKWAYDRWHQTTYDGGPHFLEWVEEKRKDYFFRKMEREGMESLMKTRAGYDMGMDTNTTKNDNPKKCSRLFKVNFFGEE